MAEPVTTTAAASAATGGASNVGAYVSGGAQLGTGILGYLGARQQRKFSQRMMEKAQAHDLSMWQKQAAYNTPAAQMQRLKEAGLNPNLVYGTGAAGATGNMSSSPGTHMQNTEVPNELAQLVIPDAISSLIQVEELKQAKEETTRKWHEARLEGTRSNQERFQYYRDTEWYDHMAKQPGMLKKYLDVKTQDRVNRYQRNATELELRTLELSLARQLKPLGISVNDPVYARLFIMLSDMLGLNISGALKKINAPAGLKKLDTQIKRSHPTDKPPTINPYSQPKW